MSQPSWTSTYHQKHSRGWISPEQSQLGDSSWSCGVLGRRSTNGWGADRKTLGCHRNSSLELFASFCLLGWVTYSITSPGLLVQPSLTMPMRRFPLSVLDGSLGQTTQLLLLCITQPALCSPACSMRDRRGESCPCVCGVSLVLPTNVCMWLQMISLTFAASPGPTSRLHRLQLLQWLPWLPWRGPTVLCSPPTLHEQPATLLAWGRVHPYPHCL